MRFRSWTSLAPLTWPHALLVPVLNVWLLLAGWVLLGPTFTTAAAVPLQLPGAVTAEAVGGAPIIITLTAQSLVYLNDRLITTEELPTALTPLIRQGQTVLIKADAHVPVGQLATLWDICRQLGAARIAMATTAPTE